MGLIWASARRSPVMSLTAGKYVSSRRSFGEDVGERDGGEDATGVGPRGRYGGACSRRARRRCVRRARGRRAAGAGSQPRGGERAARPGRGGADGGGAPGGADRRAARPGAGAAFADGAESDAPRQRVLARPPKGEHDGADISLGATWNAAATASRECYRAPSSEFRVHYVTSASGGDRPPAADIEAPMGVPDYVQEVAERADASWAVQNDDLGWPEPKPDGAKGDGQPGWRRAASTSTSPTWRATTGASSTATRRPTTCPASARTRRSSARPIWSSTTTTRSRVTTTRSLRRPAVGHDRP